MNHPFYSEHFRDSKTFFLSFFLCNTSLSSIYSLFPCSLSRPGVSPVALPFHLRRVISSYSCVSVENRIFRSKRKKHTCSEMQGRNTNKIPSVKCSTPDYSSDSYLYIYILASYLHISFFCSISFLFCRSYPGQSKELCE